MLQVVTAPDAEPLMASDLRDHLRVEASEAQDALITSYIAAARAYIEKRTGRRMITQTLRLTFDGLDGFGLVLPVAPIQSISQIVYDPLEGAAITLAEADYKLLTHEILPRACPAYGKTWPVSRAYPGSVRVDVVVGYGDAGSDVDPCLMQALRLLTAHWYENREDVVVGTATATIPKGVEALIAPLTFWT